MSTRSKAETLKQVESRLLWLSHWMIHHANNVRENDDGIKVGGHQASSASRPTYHGTIFCSSQAGGPRRSKPHASPIFHAMQYLVGNVDLERIQQFRGFGGVQSYPPVQRTSMTLIFYRFSRTWCRHHQLCFFDPRYVLAKPWGGMLPGRMIAPRVMRNWTKAISMNASKKDGSTIFKLPVDNRL